VTGYQLAGFERLRGQRVKSRGTAKAWNECVKVDMKVLDRLRWILGIEEFDNSYWEVGTVQHCLSGIKRVRTFTDCVLVTLNLMMNDDDDF